jgi:hypothetical protein
MFRTPHSLIGASLLCAFQLSAQSQSPPKVLRIIREDIKEGKSPAHEKSESKFALAMARNKYPANYLALTSMTGPSQAWFLEGHDSFVSVAETQAFEDKIVEFQSLDAVDAELRSSSSYALALYRPDLSYHSAALTEGLPKARYFNIVTIHIHFERDLEFAEIAKTAIEAAERAKSDQPVAVYQVVSGMPAGTYMLLEPAASLNALDDAPARSRTLIEAMGESGARKFLKNAGEIIAGEEPVLFAINPKMSYVSKEFAAGDSEFWTPKPPQKISTRKQ